VIISYFFNTSIPFSVFFFFVEKNNLIDEPIINFATHREGLESEDVTRRSYFLSQKIHAFGSP